MLITPHVFLDTTVFDQNSHNYSSTSFKRLAELVAENKVKIYLTQIIAREVESHIQEEIESTHLEITAILNRRRLLKNAEHPSISSIFEGIDSVEVCTHLIEKFRYWLSEMKSEVVPTDGLSVDEVLDNYFAKKAPFSDKNKSEFPDAFNIAALNRWCKERKARMYVVSADGGVYAACKDDPLLSPVRSLPEFLDLITRGERLAQIANRIFDSRYASINFELRKTIHMYSYWNHKPNERLVQSYVETMSFPEKYLIEIEDGRAVYDVLVRATHVADVVVHNAMFMTGRPQTVRRDQFLKAEVIFRFDESDESDFRLEQADIKEENVYYYPQYSEYPDIYV